MSWDDITKPWTVEGSDVELFKDALGELTYQFAYDRKGGLEKQPLHILEWGAGGSCIYYPLHLHEILEHPYVWFSVEHDPQVKHERLAGRLDPYTFIIESPIPTSKGPTAYVKAEWDEHLEGLELYYCRVGELLRPHNGYHLIYIDGFYRYSCLELAQRLLHKDGILLMDNAERADPKRLEALKFDGEFLKPHFWKARLKSE